MTELTGACLCGACTWNFDGRPEHATACNCTACRRFGALWIYGLEGKGVTLDGPLVPFARGDRDLEFLHCETCGCVMGWRGLRPEPGGVRLAVNLRMAEAGPVADLPVRSFDGYDTFAEIPLRPRTVADCWV